VEEGPGRTDSRGAGDGGGGDGGAGGGPVSPLPWRRILLVGFMGSGKSAAGAGVAEALGWQFRDLDDQVESVTGKSIPEIFREEGEEAFRQIEDREARKLFAEDEVVIASGGGWPCRAGRIAGAGRETLSIWLQVSAEVALGRTKGQDVERPLLAVAQPLDRIRELLAEREPHYRSSAWWVNTDMRPPEKVVEVIVNRLRTDPERPLRV